MICSVNARHVDPAAKYYLVAGGRRQVDLIYIATQKYTDRSSYRPNKHALRAEFLRGTSRLDDAFWSRSKRSHRSEVEILSIL